MSTGASDEQRDERRWTLGAWLTLVLTVVLVTWCLTVVVLGLSYPGGGWISIPSGDRMVSTLVVPLLSLVIAAFTFARRPGSTAARLLNRRRRGAGLPGSGRDWRRRAPARLLPSWIGWATILWNLAWLVALPLLTPRDIYYPVLHHAMPLLIGVALLRRRSLPRGASRETGPQETALPQ